MTEHLTESTTVCPCCQGEGRVEQYRRAREHGGSWDTPYHDVECAECDGEGSLWTERCDRCGLVHPDQPANGAWEVCRCDEDALEAWALTGSAPEVSEAAAYIQAASRPASTSVFNPDRRWALTIRRHASDLLECASDHPAALRLANVLDAMAERIHSERKAA